MAKTGFPVLDNVIKLRDPNNRVEKKVHDRLYDIKKHPGTAYTHNTAALLQGFKGKDYQIAKDYLNRQSAYYTNHNAPHKKGVYKRRKTIVSGINDQWQMDLLDMSRVDKHVNFPAQNKRYKYILVVIDVFTRYMWTRPLKSKSPTEVAKSLESIFREYKPNRIQSDEGREFGGAVKTLLNKYGIKLFHSKERDIKAALVERANGTLRRRFNILWATNQNNKWLPLLDDVTNAYNNTLHSSIGVTPLYALTSPGREDALWDRQFRPTSSSDLAKYKKELSKVKIGDYVVIQRARPFFEKGTKPGFTHEIYQIYNVQMYPYRLGYKLKDLNGTEIEGVFVRDQFKVVSTNQPAFVEKITRRQKDSEGVWWSLVKWFGFYDYQSWVKTSDLIKLELP